MDPSSLTRDQVREVDQLAIRELGIPGVVLMENAGIGATRTILEELGSARGPVAILCGGGNNGGDGYVVARQLVCAGREVQLFSTVPAGQLSGDALVNRAIVDRMGIPVRSLTERSDPETLGRELAAYPVRVDALLGTGFRGEVREPVLAVIEALGIARESGGKVIALDLPSGLDADRGEPSNATVQADLTTTFVAPKVGFVRPGAEAWTGRVVVVGIGVPEDLVQRVRRERE